MPAHHRLTIWALSLCCFMACQSDDPMPSPEVPPSSSSNHPFLITSASAFEAERAKAAREPWKSIADDAIARSDNGFSMNNGNSTNAYNLQKFVGAAALAYIIEPDRADTHADRVLDAFTGGYARLQFDDSGPWGGVVPNMGSLFVGILALDIVHDALSADEVNQCEQVIETQLSKINRAGSWSDARLGTFGTWDIYRGVRTTPDDAYYEGIMRQITPDGASPVTIHYAWERLGGGDSRLSKSGYMDVLEYTGIDRRYYGEERLQKFYRWLFGSSVNASREMAIIGDMLPTQNLGNHMLHRRIGNFDQEAAALGAWFHEGEPAIGNILTYLLPQAALPDPQVPSSKLYQNGGAYFREGPDDPASIHAILYNIMSQDEWHTHQEINGLALSAYGNRLLVNGGRLGAPTRPAALNNTLTLGGEEHSSRLGGGIRAGFTCEGLDFAVGRAGPALSQGQHLRSLILVHGRNATRGYVLVIDEVTNASADVHAYYHPANESQIIEDAANGTYTALIDHYPTIPGASLNLHFAPLPDEVRVEKVPSAVPERYPGYPDHNRLEAVYGMNESNAITTTAVLFPYDQTHPPAQFITEEEGTVWEIEQLTGTDLLMRSESPDTLESDGVAMVGQVLLTRKSDPVDVFVFGRGLTYLHSSVVGLESTVPTTLYFSEEEGALSIEQTTELVLTAAQAADLRFEPAVEPLILDPDRIMLSLEAGIYYFKK